MLVLTGADVEAALDLDEMLEAVASAMKELSAGRASTPNRIAVVVPDHDAFVAAMPAHLPAAAVVATKLVSVFPHNTERPTHQAVLIVFDPDNGTPVALMDGTAITSARTAAGSALSVRLLAREDARILAILGTGVQARAHLRAVPRVRAFDRIVLAGRDRTKAEALAASIAPEASVPIEVADAFEDAVRAADVVCATTHTDEPIVRYGWLKPGAHVASVGFNPNGVGEVDRATVLRSAVFVESRLAAGSSPPSGAIELVAAIDEGDAPDGISLREIGDVLSGEVAGRTGPDEITLYKSVGVAVQDAAAAGLILRRAAELGLGSDVEM